MSRPLVIAHRGFSHIAPENTISAFRAALAVGADGIETDVQLTRDGRMVMHHNYTIDAASNGHGAILSMTEEELRQYDFGSWKSPDFAGEKIPTLAECLEATKDFQVVNIELKAPMDRTIPYVGPVAQAIRDSGRMEQIIVSAFDHSLLRDIKALLPDLRVGALTLPRTAGEGFMEQLEGALPKDKPMDRITREDVTLPGGGLVNDEGQAVQAADPAAALLEMVRALSAVFPGQTLPQVKQSLTRQHDLDSYIASLDFEVNYLHCEYRSCLSDPSLIEKMHRRGVGVNPWTVDRVEDMQFLLDHGADGIITNRPDLLLELLGR